MVVRAGISRRAAFLSLLAASAASRTALAGARGARIVSIDWGLAETLIAIGASPLGLAESRGYRDWVSEPALPPGVAEIGLRSAPSLDYIAALKPDVILSTPQFAAIEPRLRTVAPVLSLATFTPEQEPLRRAIGNTRRLGAIAAREVEAERLISDVADRMSRLQNAVRGSWRKALIVTFLDERHIWAFGRGSLFDGVLKAAGIANAWTGETSVWGNANVSVDALATVGSAATIVVGPVPPAVTARLNERTTGVIPRLSAFREGAYRIAPPIWGFGGLQSAGRFADALSGMVDFVRET